MLRETGETMVKHRVEWWVSDPRKRHVVAVCDGLLAAENWCRDEIRRVAEDKTAISASVAHRVLTAWARASVKPTRPPTTS